MHPEIMQDRPGNCPLCGMALEPKVISAKEEPNVELVDMSKRFWISLFLTMPLLFITMGEHLPGINSLIELISPRISSWLQFILATPVILGCGWPLLKKGWDSVRRHYLNMFSLIALGISIAYIFSIVALLFPQSFPLTFHASNGEVNLYFEVAAAITTLVLMGQVLELKGRQQTGLALRSLLDLAPKNATKINDDDSISLIPLEQVKINDRLRIHPGEKVPVDGKIIAGHSTVNESLITGEPIPVEKTIGSKVIGGTFNQSGSFIMQAEHVGSETMLAQIVKLVSAAQRSRAPIQRLADYVSGYFVPIVIIIAMITFLIWGFLIPHPSLTYGLISAISVLIIACPCALGLATPMSIMVGMGRGAQAGILVKNAESLERLEKINTLVIDKTGTLTWGKPRVKNIIPIGDFDANRILFLAASLEQNSEHPLANAMIEAANELKIKLQNPSEFKAKVGEGIIGIIDDSPVALGNIKLLNTLHLEPGLLSEKADKLRRNGETVMFVILDNKIVGLISVSDPIKDSAPLALKMLREDGIRIVMVTGDNSITAKAIGTKLGISEIESDVLPQRKSEVIKNLQAKGHIVAMAGDGINDAPALAAADIGIAMGTGTDIAIQSSDITLLKGDLMGVVRARQLSENVMRNIRQNLVLAFIYNILCIPIAAGVIYPWTGVLLNPIIAAAVMSLSSVCVIANALRLRYMKLS